MDARKKFDNTFVRTWEPAHADVIDLLGRLVVSSSALEGDVRTVLLERRIATTFGEAVAWAWVIDTQHTHVLLVDHPHRRVWTPPGGRIHATEHPQQASARELFEETGVRGQLLHDHPALMDSITARAPDGAPVVSVGVAYLYTAHRGVELTGEPGQPAAWWPIGAPPARRAEHHWNRLTRHLGDIPAPP